jgi:hypothetical protein
MTRFGRMPLILGSVVMAIYPPVSQPQFDAHFSLPKPAYSLGEPVFIDFVVQNTDSEPLRIEKGAPYTVCQGYDFKTGACAGAINLSVPRAAPGDARFASILSPPPKHTRSTSC